MTDKASNVKFAEVMQGYFEEMMTSLDLVHAPDDELANGQAERVETSIIACGTLSSLKIDRSA